MTLVNLRAPEAPFGRVTVVLLADGETAIEPDADAVVLEVVVRRRQLDATGFVRVQLRPNADIEPAGTAYQATFTPTGGAAQSIVFGGFSGAGPVEATDHLTAAPGSLNPTGLAAEIAARIAADLDVRADLQQEIDDLVLEAGAVASVNGRAGIVTGLAEQDDLDAEEAARIQADADHAATPHGGDVSQQDLNDAIAAEATARAAAIASAIAALVDSSPGLLDTLNELAAALGDDPNFATTITTLIGTKETPAGAQAKANAAQVAAEATAATALSSEASTRGSADSLLSAAILSAASDLDDEVIARTAGLAALTATVAALQAQVTALTAKLAAEGLGYTYSSDTRPTGWAGILFRRPDLPGTLVEASDIFVEYDPPTGAATVTPAAVAAVAGVGGPTVHTGSTATPAAVAAVAGVGSPVVSAGGNATVTPAAVAAVAGVGAPVVDIGATGATVTPAAVAAVAGVGSPTLSTGSATTPAAVAAVAAVGVPVVSTGGGSAITATHLTSGADGTDQAVYTTASITVPGGQATVICIGCQGGASTAAPVVTQAGVTWDLAASNNASLTMQHLFVCAPGSNQTGAITITFDEAKIGADWRVVTFPNSKTGTNGAAALGTAVTGSQASGSSISVTLAALEDALSMAVGFIRCGALLTPTPGSGHAAIGAVAQGSTPTVSAAAEGQLNTTTVNWTGINGITRVIAVEVKAV